MKSAAVYDDDMKPGCISSVGLMNILKDASVLLQ